MRDLRKSWEKGERAWVNMHLSMYLYSPSSKHPAAHARAFAACSVSTAGPAAGRLLKERCRDCGRQWRPLLGIGVALTPLLSNGVDHSCPMGSVTIEELAWELLGVDLEESPLPRASARLPTIPRVMPDEARGHNPRVYGSPWFAHKPAVPYHKALLPSHPPPTCFHL